jgi:flagellar capping protein FliD
MGTFDEDEQKFTDVKKDMGSFKYVNTFLNELNTAQNSLYKLDGVFISSHSNDDTQVVPGTTFTLKKADPNLNIKLSLDVDISGLADRITEFVNDFNEILKFIDENTKAITVEKRDEVTGIRSNERIIAAFTGDSAIASMKDQLNRAFKGIINELTSAVDNGYSTKYSSIASMGIMTTREGYLEVNNEKLTKALTEDMEGVRRLFTADSWSDTQGFKMGNFMRNSTTGTYEFKFTSDGSVSVFKNGEEVEVQQQVANLVMLKNGITIETPWQSLSEYEDKTVKVTFTRGVASQIQNFVEIASQLTMEIGGTITGEDGLPTNILKGPWAQLQYNYEKRIEDLQKRADVLQVRVDSYNARIQAQFAALEKSLSALQNQSANMISALSALTPGKK